MATTEQLSLTTADFLTWIQKKSPKDVIRLGKHMQYGRENKYITARFDVADYPKGIELIHITDVQFGHVCCREDRVKEWLDWILAVPNRFVILGGDLVDAATKLSVGSPFENKWEPNEQCWRFVEMFLPIRHRILGYVGGNHERRANPTFGSLGLLIATLLRCPYSAGKQYIRVFYGGWEPFKVALWHGGGSARTKGAKAQMLHRFMLEGDDHLYLVGHLHDAIVLPEWRLVDSRKANRMDKEKYYGIMSSSFMEYWSSYAEVASLSATDTMMARVILYPDRKSEVTMR